MQSGSKTVEFFRPVTHTLAGPLETEELISKAQSIGRLEMKENYDHKWIADITFYTSGGSYVSAKGTDRSLNAALMAACDEAETIIQAVGRRS